MEITYTTLWSIAAHWVRGVNSPGLKQLGRETDHSLPSSTEVKNGGAIPTLPKSSQGTTLPFTLWSTLLPTIRILCWTLSIVRRIINIHSVSESGSVFVSGCREEKYPIQLIFNKELI
jgi:hypothetical protein